MSVDTLNGTPVETSVGMAQIALLSGDDRAKIVLGSCIGLVLYHKARKIAAVAHIVLPCSLDRDGPPGKFADTAIPYMVEQLVNQKASQSGLVAKLAGGANMFGSTGPIQIGSQNYDAIIGLLKGLRIPVAGEHVGGQKGRRIVFQCDTGDLKINMAGEAAQMI